MKDPRLKRLLVLSSYGLAMLLISILLVFALSWVSPHWLDSVALWRSAETVDDLALHEVEASLETAIEEPLIGESLLQDMAITVSYEPRLGALAEHSMGASFSLPSGALRGAATIRVEPVLPQDIEELPKNAKLLGFGFKILIDGIGDKQLRKAASLTLKVIVPEPQIGALRIVQRDGSGWKVPTTRRRGSLLTISVDRSGVYFPVAWGSVAEQSDLNQLVQNYLSSGALVEDARLNRLYDTQHFQIFFADRGVHAVPNDASFPLRPKTNPERVNAFVTIVGETLEEVYLKLETIGLARLEERINVYLSSTHGDAMTPLGGSIWISVKTDIYDDERATDALRGTVTEALLRSLLSNGTPWFNELKAAYLTDLFWELQGQPIDYVQQLLQRFPTQAARLLELPMGKGQKTYHRLYASFFSWLNERGDVPDLLRRLQGVTSVNSKLLSRVLQQRGQPSLGDLLAFFARDYYHDRYWQKGWLGANLFEGSHVQQAVAQSGVPESFVTGVRQRGNLYRNIEQISLAPFSSMLVPIVDYKPLQRPARFVFLADFRGSKPTVAYAAAQMGDGLPVDGVPERFQERQPNDDRLQWTLSASLDKAMPNHVSFVFTNVREDEPTEIIRLSRWMLHAPVWAAAQRSGNETRLYWEEGNKGALESVFAGYHIYSMAAVENFAEASLVQRGVMSPSLVLPDFNPDLRYAVTLADVYGNESPPTFFSREDPFVGQWRGRIRWLGREGSDARQKALLNRFLLEEIDGKLLPDPQHFIWRAGIPVKFEISRDQGLYRMQVTQLGWNARVPRPSDPSLERMSRYGLFFRAEPHEDAQRVWTLTRADQIQGQKETETGVLDWFLWRDKEGSGS